MRRKVKPREQRGRVNIGAKEGCKDRGSKIYGYGREA